MATKPIVKVLEKCQISPPPAADGRSLPLTFLDMMWLSLHPVHHLMFYEFPRPTTDLINTVVPKLKHSLSFALGHFFPFAGKLIIFRTPTKKPEIRYVDGDSVSLTFAESCLDFDDLVRNNPRDCDKFYPLVPFLGHATKLSDCVKVPVFSVQVTVFPNSGFCIGITNHHSLGDASTRFCFMNAWTSIARSGTDELFLAEGPLPCYDRVVGYEKLDDLVLSKQKFEALHGDYQPPSLVGPTDKVRATFVLTRPVLDWLKTRASAKLSATTHVSSFTVACAYIWSCIARSVNTEIQVFIFSVDCRARVDPPLPPTYFGNCIVPVIAMTETPLLAGDEGFVNAAKSIGEALRKMLNHKDGIMKNMEELGGSMTSSELKPTAMTVIGVAGTPKLKFYDMDFGWWRPKKYETISIDYTGSISVNACRESTEDIEIGVCLSQVEMEAFIGFFNGGLQEYAA